MKKLLIVLLVMMSTISVAQTNIDIQRTAKLCYNDTIQIDTSYIHNEYTFYEGKLNVFNIIAAIDSTMPNYIYYHFCVSENRPLFVIDKGKIIGCKNGNHTISALEK